MADNINNNPIDEEPYMDDMEVEQELADMSGM